MKNIIQYAQWVSTEAFNGGYEEVQMKSTMFTQHSQILCLDGNSLRSKILHKGSLLKLTKPGSYKDSESNKNEGSLQVPNVKFQYFV